MAKQGQSAPLGQGPTSPPAPPQGAPGGSRWFDTCRTRGRATERLTTAVGARASCLQCRRSHCMPLAVQVAVRLLHLPQPEGELALRCVWHLALPPAAAVAAHSGASLARAPHGSGPGSALHNPLERAGMGVGPGHGRFVSYCGTYVCSLATGLCHWFAMSCILFCYCTHLTYRAALSI